MNSKVILVSFVFVATFSFTLGQLPTLPPINWENVTVESDELGKIVGLKAWTSGTQKLFYTFHGIPYAQPTGGDARFKPSVLKEDIIEVPHFLAWDPLIACPQGGLFRSGRLDLNNVTLPNVLKATRNWDWEWNNEKNQTEQIIDNGGSAPKYSEDENLCLVLNINTPLKSRGENRKYPVIFYMHGGSSTQIWGSTHMGFRLLERDVILVTINYRLGVLGALNLGIDNAPGNAAMYDCITALRWVQKYIHLFNGDKDNVIAYGESAGGMMASHLLLSPLAAGLIHGVIGSSGSALVPWGTAQHPSINDHLTVSQHAGCYDPANPTTMEQVYECMKLVDVNELRSALSKYSNDEQKVGRLGFDAKSPSVQWGNVTIPKFMPLAPYEVLKQGKQNNIPLILGANRHDGSFAFEDVYQKFLKANGLVNNTEFMKKEMITVLLDALKMPDRSGVMHQAFAKQYFGESIKHGIFWDMLPGFIDITSVFGFKAGAYQMVEMHAKLNPKSYYYAFDYKGFWTTYDLSGGSYIPGGVAHIDDIMYVFQAFPLFTEGDLGVSKRMIDWIVNFAYFQDPNGESGEILFPPYDPIDHTYLKIDKEDSIEKHCRDSWIGTAYEIVDLKHPFQ